eukprot:TRINITY_DN3133_c0_g1_i5.p1 TRINITY_DN3133_c0_g1~~TRINITY_DN3133_c0_g1_i5.p1  ORF type:complete len:992 (-),score=193.26 TRINITY_DN3133_c0_g1_i5:389-3364(-)
MTLGTIGGPRTLEMRVAIYNRTDGSLVNDTGTMQVTGNLSFGATTLAVSEEYEVRASSYMAGLPSDVTANYSLTNQFFVRATPTLVADVTGVYAFLTHSQTAPTCAGSCSIYSYQQITFWAQVAATECNLPTENQMYTWTVADSSMAELALPAGSGQGTSQLTLPANYLTANKQYNVKVAMSWVTAGGVTVTGDEGYSYSNTTTAVTVLTEPVSVTILQGPSIQIGSGSALVLNSSVYDPDNGAFALSGSWVFSGATSCPAGTDCSNYMGLTVPAGTLSAGSYTVTLTVQKVGDVLPQTSVVTVTVVSGTVQPVAISRANSNLPFPAGETLVLSGSSSGGVRWAWTVQCLINGELFDVCNPALDLDSAAVPNTLTSSSTQNLVLKPDSLGGYGRQYQFNLQAWDSSGVSGTGSMSIITAYRPECNSNCLTVTYSSPAVSLSTNFTITAPKGVGYGWFDRDDSGVFTYEFGFTRDGQSYMLTSSPSSSNSLITSKLPPGTLYPFVIVHDATQGSVGPVHLGQASSATNPLSGTPALIWVNSSTSSATLESSLTYTVGSTAALDVLLSIQAVGFSMAADDDSGASALRDRLARDLKAVTDGEASDLVGISAGVLESLLEQPSKLSAGATADLNTAFDSILAAATAIDAATTLSLVEAAENIKIAQDSSGRRTAYSDSERLLLIAELSAADMTVDDPSRLIEARHISGNYLRMQLQKVLAGSLGDFEYGSQSLGGSVRFTASSSPTYTSPYTVVVVMMNPGNPLNFQTTSLTLASNVASALVLVNATVVQDAASSMSMTLYNTKDNPSPTCLQYVESMGAYETTSCTLDQANSYQAIGGAVVCDCNTGSGANLTIGTGCYRNSTCSGHGTCQEDSSCKCDESWWGRDCAVQRCTDVTTCGPNGFYGTCVFNSTASSFMAPGFPRVDQPEGDQWLADLPTPDPVLYGDCVCRCGFAGPLCEEEVTCELASAVPLGAHAFVTAIAVTTAAIVLMAN